MAELKEIDYYLEGNRLSHCLGVEQEMDLRVSYKCEVYRSYLTQAAKYHDIGYSDKINKETSHHNIDGYLYIKDKVHPLTAYLILEHTGVRGFLIDTDLYDKYIEIEKAAREEVKRSGNVDMVKVELMVNLLTTCDILRSSTGEKVTGLERLLGVKERYSEESKEYKNLEKEIQRLNLYY